MLMGSNSNGYRSLSVKAVGISAAVVSAGVMLHRYTSGAPSIFFRFASSEIPNLYGSLVSWLTPPYLYFVINGIIISIAASSKFHKSSSSSSGSQLLDHHHDVFGSPSASSAPTLVTKQQQQQQQQEYAAASAPPPVVVEGEVNVVPAAARADEEGVENSDDEKEEFEEVGSVTSRSTWAPNKTESVTAAEETDYNKEKEQSQVLADYSFFLTEKPLVSSRLGRRKSLKATPEGGRTLRVSRPKRNDTLESTWRAITDGRAVPLTRHLKKSDTWETNHHTQQQRQLEPVVVRKCEAFAERDGECGARRPPLSSGAAARLMRKEPSIGQDDLNRRVEAFINKFNQEMKLQRQESFKHYFDMINRGSH